MSPDSQPKVAPEPVLGGTPASAPAAPAEPAKAKDKKRVPKKRLAIIIAAIAAAASVITFLVVLIIVIANREIDIFKTDAFFLPESSDSSAKYALFKNDGRKLTDFEFTSVGGFVNGYSNVRNSDGKVGIIDHNGNMTVEFGKYEYIQALVGFYVVAEEKNQTTKPNIILGNGSVLAEEVEKYVGGSSAPYIAIKTEGDKYELYNALGNHLASFTSSKEPSINIDGLRTASSVSYDGGLIILSNKNYKPMKTIETSTSYAVYNATDDIKAIVFKESSSSSDNAKYAIYENGKFTELGDRCKSIDISENTVNSKNYYLTCYDSNSDKLLIRDGSVTDKKVAAYGTGYYVYDQDHYAYYDSSEKTIKIYVNDSEKTSAKADSISLSYKGYEITNRSDKKVTLFDIDGNDVMSIDGVYSDLRGLDKNDNIIVYNSENDRKERYSVFNRSGKELSGKYSSINAYGEYYEAFVESDKKGDLLNKSGEVIVSGEYEDFDFYDKSKVVIGEKYDNKSDLIDPKGKKVLASFDGSAYYYDSGYVKVTTDSEYQFYTKEGKMFHSYSKRGR